MEINKKKRKGIIINSRVNNYSKNLRRLTQRYHLHFASERKENLPRGTEIQQSPIKETQDKMPGTEQNNHQPAAPLVLSIDPLKYIGHLPEYTGRGDELFTFIELVENIVPLILKYDSNSQKILLNRLKSKLHGKAREVMEINNHVKNWSEMKSVLVNNFGDKKSAIQIFDKLRSDNFTLNSVDLYNQIKSVLRRLNNKVKDEPNSHLTIKANIETGLKIFKEKLPEPMHSILFSRNPSTLEEALDILFEGNYAYYNPLKNCNKSRNLNNHYQHRNNFQRPSVAHPNDVSHNYNPNFRQSTQHYNSSNNTNPRRNNYHNNENLKFRQSNGNHQSFFRSYQPNRSQNFRQNQQTNSNTNSRPEAMDVDPTINSRIHSLETQNQIENFQSTASEDNTPYLI